MTSSSSTSSSSSPAPATATVGRRRLSRWHAGWLGAKSMLPLTLAVIPWGILAGALAMDAGLPPWQGQALSLLVFAGAAQLVAIGMVQSHLGWLPILATTVLITARHLLYGMAWRRSVLPLSRPWRLGLGFLLTDELFALHTAERLKAFDPWFALGAGVSFYLGWNLATLLGVVAGHSLPDLTHWGLDFAVVATFIALVLPACRGRAVWGCVLSSALLSVVGALYFPQVGLLVASLGGMAVGYGLSRPDQNGEGQA